ncbi:MAG: radical SAM protein [Myxococcales bacterium]|nr:radical SAM protein [Myxococcales bacterium]
MAPLARRRRVRVELRRRLDCVGPRVRDVLRARRPKAAEGRGALRRREDRPVALRAAALARGPRASNRRREAHPRDARRTQRSPRRRRVIASRHGACARGSVTRRDRAAWLDVRDRVVGVRPVNNPPNVFHRETIEFDEDAQDLPPGARLELFEERARSIVSENDSPDVGFRYSINPYRGCTHGCAYCYARPSHQYLGFGAGTDFDRKIVVKLNAPELLRARFEHRSWNGDMLVFSGNTDCYQPIEKRYELTRRCLEVCAEFRNPIGVITKSTLVLRDVDLLAKLSKEASASVYVSIAFDNDEDGLALDPWAPKISRRLEVVRALADAGVRVGVSTSPVIFGLNDSQVISVLARARELGATKAFATLLRVPSPLDEVFFARVAEVLPGRAARIERSLVELRGGRRDESRFGHRMVGLGPRWDAFRALYDGTCKRLGYDTSEANENAKADTVKTFRRPQRQGSLF